MPIVALTAHALVGDEARFLAGGMDGYVSKPIDAALLAAEIERLGRHGDELDAPLRDRLLEAFARDREALVAATPDFVRICDERLARLRVALAEGDALALRHDAVALRQAAGDLGAAGLAEASGAGDSKTRRFSLISTPRRQRCGSSRPRRR